MSLCLSLPSSLQGGCDQATGYHVPDGILIFSGSEGGKRGRKGALVRETCQGTTAWATASAETRMMLSCKSSTHVPTHVVAPRVTSCSVQSRDLLSHRELNRGNSVCTEPVPIPLTSPLHSGLIWTRLFTKHLSSRFHNNPAHHTWRIIFNHLPGILQTVAHKTNTSQVSHLLC